MNRSRLVRLVFVALLPVAMFAVSAGGQTIPAQDNTWTTGNGTQIDFSSFGNVNLATVLGSAPTNSVVTLEGVPLSSQIGSADTLVQSGQVDVTSGTNKATLTLEALSMASHPDLLTQDGRTFHITVSLAFAGNGSASFTRTAGTDGGTYDSSFTVTPVLVFTNVVNSSDTHTVDCSQQANSCSFVMGGTGGTWVLSSSSGFDPMSLGIPVVPSGVKVGGYTTVGRSQFGAIYPGVVHNSSGYSINGNNEFENAGKAGHGTQPPQDCKSGSPSTGASQPDAAQVTLQLRSFCIFRTNL